MSHWTVAVSVSCDPGCVWDTREIHSGAVVLMAELVTLQSVSFCKFLRRHLFNSFGQSKVVFLIFMIFGETKSCQENIRTYLI